MICRKVLEKPVFSRFGDDYGILQNYRKLS